MNINSSLKKTPIAVIGLSAMFADAKNIEEYWTNIIQSIDSIKDVPPNRWLIDDYYDEDMTAPDKTYCKRGGFLPEIDFNPMEFGLPPNILEVTDASQLLGLVAARDAFEDAGYGRNSAKFTKELKEKTGVLLGVGGGQKLITPLITRLQYPIWERALRASGVSEEDIPKIVAKMKSAYVGWNENAFPGLLGNVISGRITNRFDLGGINSVVDAACAASLSAIKMSLSELVEGRCDMMLTGGVDTDNSPFMYMSFSKTPAFSKSGNISPFSDKADGMLIGEGLGMLVLKRLADAERDGDRIYSVIKGVGTSSDGRFKSVYAPRPTGQALAMNRAYKDAGYAASTVGLVEAHGTGTNAGDLAEFTSMQMVFGADNPKKQSVAVGSVKSQVGHTKAAAGAAGIIKAVLALHHKILPPTINVAEPSTKLNIKDSAIYINTEARPWLQNGHPRRTGVSAFGFGGINVHITMEEYLGSKSEEYRLHEPFKSILLQASSPSELHQLANDNLAQLTGSESESAFNSLVSQSKEINISQQNARLGFVVNSKQECIKVLEASIKQGFGPNAWSHPNGASYRASGIDLKTNKVAAIFAGQGSQYVGMGKELANAFPKVAQTFEQVDQLYPSSTSNQLSKKIFPIPVFSKEEKVQQQLELTKTQFAQPAIGALSISQFKVLQGAGFSPQFTAGHSFGELTALWAAGVYDDTTFLSLAKTRGEAMAIDNPAEDSGTMLAVKAEEQAVTEAIKNIADVKIANVNSNKQVVLGGSTAAIKIAEEQLKANGFSVVPLPVAAAFHTDFVKHAQLPFSTFVDQQSFNSPNIPVYSNTTGEQYPTDVNNLKSILKNQILNPVLFKNQIENLYKAGARVFIEFGPKGILTNLVTNILEGKEHYAIAVNSTAKKDSDFLFRQAAVQMQVLGLALSNLDPYKKEIAPLPAKSKLTVALSGNNFVSSGTQKAHIDIMSDGFQISGGKTTVVEKEVEKIITVEKIVEVPANRIIPNQPENEEEVMNKEVLELLKATLDSFIVNQTKSLEIFERYMNEQNRQSESLLNIFSQHLSVEKGNGINTAVPLSSKASNGANGSIPSISNGRTTSPSSNGNHENAVSTTAIPVPAVQSPAVSPSKNDTAIDTGKLTSILLEVVSEKTGYPAEMLELSMNMEADLGIDSIKRVEIFGALTKQHPEMSSINPNELTELRTLAEIVDFVSGNIGGSTATDQVVSTPSTDAPVAAAKNNASNGSHSSSNGSGANNSYLTNALLQVVSEKTGYPAEMLELNMDMEADLGIDSIKRVEIFGALTKQHPEMSSINPNELTELRTLGEIVDFVSGNIGGSTATDQVVSAPSTDAPVAAANNNASNVSHSSSNGSGANNSHLTNALLQVVSEKTGYPAEMLELNMDMEADLGIDSIKRVEIFGALTKQHPEMSSINPNELTELRTLAEIVDFVSGNLSGNTTADKVTSAPSTDTPLSNVNNNTSNGTVPSSNGNGTDQSHLTNALLQVVSEKTGYPAEMLELNMDMEADLGIDSIKRVEIFGSLTKQYPELSGINPNELTELRTLAEIVSYVSANSKKKSNNATHSEKLLTTEIQAKQGMVKTSAFHDVKRFEVGLKYLPQPDLLEFSMPASHVILLTNDGTELTSKVITALEKKGNSVVILNLKGINNPIDRNAISLSDSSDQAIGNAIQEVQEKYGKIGSFIHLHPHFEFQKPNFTQHITAEKEIVKALFFIAKHIQSDLNELGKQQRASFLCCTRMDGHLGQGKRGNTSVVGGGITGLVKCLNLEWSPVFCRAVDIQPELSAEQVTSQLLAEYQDANVAIVEVAYSEEGRKTTVAIPSAVQGNQMISTTVNRDSVFLVSGGARGVTANCVIEMAKTFQCKFILLGRSGIDFEIPEFAKTKTDEATLKRLIMHDITAKGEQASLPKVKSIFKNIIAKKEIDETLSTIQNHGGEVVYIQGDVTDLSSFQVDLNQASTQLGKVTGIIHGAGRLADKYIQDKTERDFENVLSVKLDGLLSLLGAVNIDQLDHLILFSSVAGFYGNVGQTDYAIANEILSKAAHLTKTNHPKIQVSAINWGAWDSGMVSGELKAQFEAAGISLVNSEGGAAMLVNELNSAYSEQPQVIIGGTLPAAVSFLGALRTYRVQRHLKLEDNPFLNHHKIKDVPVLPVVNAVAWMAQSCEKLYPDYAVFKVENTSLFKGIIFDGKEKENYILEIKELEKGDEKIVFETTVLTEGGKLPTNHYRATVTILNKKSFPASPKFTHQVSGTYQPTDGQVLYEDGSLFHAPYFQGIKEILDCNEKQIVLSCIAEEVPLSEQGQFPVNSINTFFADIQYQGMLVWVQKNYDGAKSLPLQTESAVLYRPIPFGKKLFVNIMVQEANEMKLIANCTVYDEHGDVYIKTMGASVTISRQLVW